MTHHYLEILRTKLMFAGKIEIGAGSNVYRTPWAEMIKAAKTALPCWNVDTQVIWDAFRGVQQGKGQRAGAGRISAGLHAEVAGVITKISSEDHGMAGAGAERRSQNAGAS